MYYHGSKTGNIKVIKPSVSNHKVPYVYFSSKRENILVYLSNPIEKYCKENNLKHKGKYHKWAAYGFNKEGKLQIQEYYPNATYRDYKGVGGYIYSVKDVPNIKKLDDISDAYATKEEVKVDNVEYIEDIYDEIMKEVKKGNIEIIKYEEFIKKKKEWLEDVIKKEYDKEKDDLEYKSFLESRFDFLK